MEINTDVKIKDWQFKLDCSISKEGIKLIADADKVEDKGLWERFWRGENNGSAE